MSLGQAHWSALRLELSRALRSGSALQSVIEPMLSDIANIEMGLPAHIGDYTDFYISLHHATSIGKQFSPDNLLLTNYRSAERRVGKGWVRTCRCRWSRDTKKKN